MEQDPIHIIFYRCNASKDIIPQLHPLWSYESVEDLRAISSSGGRRKTCVLSSFCDEVYWEYFLEENPETPFFLVLENLEVFPVKSACDVIYAGHTDQELQTRIQFGFQKFEHMRKLLSSRDLISKHQKIQLDLNDRLLKTSVELKEAKERIEELSLTDPLTKVKNRRFLDFQLPRELHQSQRYNTPLSLLLMDIDHFKSINDNYGHPFGDEILVRLGELIMLCLRDTDWAARYGGEEFAIVLPMTGQRGALKTAERLRLKVEFQLSPIKDKAFSVSIGVSCLQEGQGREELIKVADDGLYKAKAAGRNCVYFFNNQTEDFSEFTSGAAQ